MKFILTPILLILNFYVAISQGKGNKSPQTDSINSSVYCEKVYLHTDRIYYFAGDDIWFKAYLVDAFTNNLINNSNILYVELISPDSKIVQRRIVQISEGIGNGDFHLSNNMSPGHYLLRAYTNWMRNFGDNFVFKKMLLIESAISDKTSEKEIVQKESQIDIQFFPEGGSLVDNIQILVGFKAINSEGLGCYVSGEIISSEGDSITEFESTHLGMGTFYLTPLTGVTYYASGKTREGLEFNVKLPSSFISGIALRGINTDKTRLFLSVITNPHTLPSIINKILRLEIQSHNFRSTVAGLKIVSFRNSFSISINDLPEGIARLTISDDEGKPLCERLIYIHHQPETILSVMPDKKEYKPRSQTSLSISTTDTSDKAIFSIVSLSVTDADVGKNVDLYQSDIASYFLLESEIKGSIEQPGYYFDPLNTDRFKNLDILLLTQGWRDFIWKYIPDTMQIEYPVEHGFPISGRLTTRLFNKPLQSANIALIVMAEEGYYYSVTKTNPSGYFAFNDLKFPGKVKMVVSVSDEKLRYKGFLSLDSIIKTVPDVDFSFIPSSEVIPEVITSIKDEAINIDRIKKKYSLLDTIQLPAVVITARKPQDLGDTWPQIYSNPDYVLKIDDKTPFVSNIFMLMQGNLPGVTVIGTYPNIRVTIRGVSNYGGSSEALFLLDGTPVEIDMIAGLVVSDIDRIDILKTAGPLAVFGIRGANGVISIITKRGSMGSYKPPVYSINNTVYGYDVPRIFYSPKYDSPNSESQIPDLRTTIYWNPNIYIVNDSISKVNYYNGDKPTTAVVKVEGMTHNGIPVTAKASYIIK